VLLGTPWGNTLGTYRTYWELEGNMSGTKEKRKNELKRKKSKAL
jgi:hypothetical protein